MSRAPVSLLPRVLALGLGGLVAAGCGPVSSSGGGGGSPPAGTAPGQTATRPPSSTPPGGGFTGGPGTQTIPPPPILGGGGRSGGSAGGSGSGGTSGGGSTTSSPGRGQPPTSTLPPPASAAELAARIQETYGVVVTGPGASEANLSQIERSLEEFQVGHTRGLTSINVPLVHGLQSLQGLWETRNGRTAKITVWAQTGRPDQVTLHTMVHELGHHMTLLSRRSWGDRFDGALGRSSTAFPSSYSRTSPEEKMAENLAFSLLGDEVDQRPLSGWNPSGSARDLMNQEFGARLSLD